MDKIVPIIYMVGVFLLILPAFMNSNNNFTHRIDISDNESGILILKINKKEKVFIKKVLRK